MQNVWEGGGHMRCIMRDVQVAYITNQFDDQPCSWLLAQLVRALHWYRSGQGSNPGKRS